MEDQVLEPIQIRQVVANPIILKRQARQKVYVYLPIVFICAVFFVFLGLVLSNQLGCAWKIGTFEIKTYFFGFILLGFLAQSIDGAIGMAFGLVTTTTMLMLGFPPATASACVHISEVFTTGTSGFSHWQLGNVNKKLFRHLIIPALIGVVLGAYILTSVDGKIIKPFVSVYLMVMGVVVLIKAINLEKVRKKKTRRLGLLGFTGAFMDSIGGGGWGAIVTSNLLSQRRSPRYTIGTVNFTEFFVTFVSAGTFILLLKLSFENYVMILCIIIGAVPASFFSAYLIQRLKAKTLMFMVGWVIISLSLMTISAFLF